MEENKNIYEPQYIIVQAGGKGTRLKQLTRNKPKALTSINNLPMIFHLFKKYPNAKYVIIGDYKFDVLQKYLAAFATVEYELVNSQGFTGTCAGIKQACSKLSIKSNKQIPSLMLIWSDLILEDDFYKNEISLEKNYIGLSQQFTCRWKYEKGQFIEAPSQNSGVAGVFIFNNTEILNDVPENGEFVRWLQSKNAVFEPLLLKNTKEYGLYEIVNGLGRSVCRPFNRLTIQGDRVIKEGIDEQGKQLAQREQNWYQQVKELGFKNLPEIYNTNPLEMEKINGNTLYSYVDLDLPKKQEILKKVVTCLKDLHNIDDGVKFDIESYRDNYFNKTLSRLEKVRDLVPFANEEYITINGKKCRNVFACLDKIENEIMKYTPHKFKFIHGDCTFSNILLRGDEPVLIDPRGYFGKTELYGDTAYDWAKLYYSIIGNYDQFNLKNFDLIINENEVLLNIESNGWESLKDDFIRLVSDEVTAEQLNLIHALIWLSLTTYAWDNYDSICGAFYNGVYILNQCEFMHNDEILPYFDSTLQVIRNSFLSLKPEMWENLVQSCMRVIKNGGKIIASGLGKNVPICEKFVGTLNSFGIDARFLHTNTAMHGDLGIVTNKDIVFLLSKSGNTEESITLSYHLLNKGAETWLFSFNKECELAKILDKQFILDLQHEGDLWNIAPNNSTTIFLIVLQGLAIELSKRLNIPLSNFKINHPGGSIGKKLANI